MERSSDNGTVERYSNILTLYFFFRTRLVVLLVSLRNSFGNRITRLAEDLGYREGARYREHAVVEGVQERTSPRLQCSRR